MKAGRELDILIAEKRMGWTKEEIKVRLELDLPHYSTNIAAAWEIFADESYARLELVAGDWVCSFYTGMPAGAAVGVSESAAHAICLAALKATEEK